MPHTFRNASSFLAEFHVFICARSIKLFYKSSTYRKVMNLKNQYLQKFDCALLRCLTNLHVQFHPILPNRVLYTAAWTVSLQLHSWKTVPLYTLQWTGGEGLLHCCTSRYTHNTIGHKYGHFITGGFLYATAQSMAQHRDHNHISCGSRFSHCFVSSFGTHNIALSFGWPAQRMFYFKSAHLCLATAGLTP
jgi:hypothetical protein